MSIRSGLIRVPSWLGVAMGVGLTAGVTAAASGIVGVPRWFQSVRPGAERGARPSAERAERAWQASADVVAQAKVAAGVIRDDAASRRDALLGAELTPLVTTLGTLEAKRLTLTPRWAGAIAAQLAERGIGKGDVVAAAFSGSFPALNLAVMSACQALDVRLIAVSSVTASSWGGTQPGFTWPEIEVRVAEAGALRPVTVAISAGGAGDRGLDLEADGRQLARDIAERTARALGADVLAPADFEESVQARLRAFDRHRGGSRRFAAFINVGGTEASLGHSTAILKLSNGWLPPGPFDHSAERGLVARMAERGVPVLHLLNVRDLAARWGLL